MKKVFLGILLFAGAFSNAAEMYDVKFDDQIKLDGKTLVLNGMGLRDKTILAVSIRVYVGGLYLISPSSDPDAILKSKDPKVVRTQFKRNVKAKDVKNGWKDGLTANCEDTCKALEPTAEKLYQALVDVKEGDVLEYRFKDSSNVEVLLNETSLVKLTDASLVSAMLKTWLGPKPVTEGLKKALLGLSKKN
ncbi:MAG: chalcone isomerase family protein [Oligoflexia bacterium]|nr:chalcone isomerase family protein [Oligoflexia bacterium]